MKVSIIIPVYNGSNYLEKSINSALNQTYNDIEVIVVNDGSTDDGATANIAKKYGDKIRYFEKQNGGVASALNYGIKKATGYYISWLSHDDLYEPTKIEDEINKIKEIKKKDAIIFSDFRYINENNEILEEIELNKKIVSLDKYFVFYKRLLCSISLLIPKKMIIKCKMFDPAYKYTQDYDMWYKLIKKYRFYYLNKILVSVRLHSQQSSNVDHGVVEESEEFWRKHIYQENVKTINSVFGSLFYFFIELYNTFKYSEYESLKKELSDKIKESYFDELFDQFFQFRKEHDFNQFK